jgi:N-acetylneuraminic acid mutarotase
MRTQRETELGQLLRRRRSLQELIDQNIILSGPEIAPQVQEARRKILRNSRENTLNAFLEKRPSLSQIAQQNVLTDTMTWTRVTANGALPSARNCHAIAVYGENLFLTGGYGAQGKFVEILVFEPECATWIRPVVAGQIPEQRYSHSCEVIGPKLFLFGGCSVSDERYFNDLSVLDINQKIPISTVENAQEVLMWHTIQPVGEVPSPRAAHSATVVGEQIYFFGGNDGIRLFNDLHVFDSLNKAWKRLETSGEIPSPRAGHTATLVGERSIFVYGGGTIAGPTNDLFILDIVSLVWVRPFCKGTAPRPRISHSAAVLMQDQLIIFGGGTMNRVFDDLHIFDVNHAVWSRPRDSGTIPMPRAGHTFSAIDSKIYVLGGANCEGDIFCDMHVLDTAFLQLKNVVGTTPTSSLLQIATSADSQTDLEGNQNLSQDKFSKIIRKSEVRLTKLLENARKDADYQHQQIKLRLKQVSNLLNVRYFMYVGTLYSVFFRV